LERIFGPKFALRKLKIKIVGGGEVAGTYFSD
jgi:hypothetical protein